MKALIAAVAVLASLVAAPAPGTAQAPASQTDRAAVPGDGWYLAAVEEGRPTRNGIAAKRFRLELVAPDGDRRRVVDLSARRGGYLLTDWSPDGRTAFLVAAGERGFGLAVDVATGDTARVPLVGVADASLAPDGAGVLATGFENGRGRRPLFRIAWDGTRTRLSPDVDGRLLTTPDGTGIVDHGSRRQQRVIRVLSAADGSVRTAIPTPRSCDPVRWWDDHRLLVTCFARGATTLGLVDLRAAAYTPLTERRKPQRNDLGHLDARRVGGRLYVQVAGPCGYAYLGRERRDGRITRVRVPRATGNVLLVDAAGDRLVLQHALTCDRGVVRSTLASFDPATGRERRLVVLPRDEAFAAIFPYGERRPTGY